jgi:hypothetical protein
MLHVIRIFAVLCSFRLVNNELGVHWLDPGYLEYSAADRLENLAIMALPKSATGSPLPYSHSAYNLWLLLVPHGAIAPVEYSEV